MPGLACDSPGTNRSCQLDTSWASTWPSCGRGQNRLPIVAGEFIVAVNALPTSITGIMCRSRGRRSGDRLIRLGARGARDSHHGRLTSWDTRRRAVYAANHYASTDAEARAEFERRKLRDRHRGRLAGPARARLAVPRGRRRWHGRRRCVDHVRRGGGRPRRPGDVRGHLRRADPDRHARHRRARRRGRAPLYDEATVGVEAPCTSEGFATPGATAGASCRRHGAATHAVTPGSMPVRR